MAMDKAQIRFMGDYKKLSQTVNGLVTDVKNLKAAVDRLDRENRQLRADLDLVARNALGEAK